MIPLIILSLILLLLVLLLIPLRFYILFDKDTEINLKYLLFCFDLNKVNKKPKKEGKSEKGNKENKKFDIRKKINQDGLFRTVYDLVDLLNIILKKVGFAIKHTVINDFEFNIKVSGDDAADTAIKYGKICAAVYPAIGLIESNVKKIKRQDGNIYCVYDNSLDEFKFRLEIKLSPLFLVMAAIGMLFDYLKLKIKNSKGVQ